MPETPIVRRLTRAVEKFYESDPERFAGFNENQMNTALARELVAKGWIDPNALVTHDATIRNVAFQEAANIAFKRKSGYETGIDLLAAANDSEPIRNSIEEPK